MGEKFSFNMLTWLHTCFAFNLEDGTSIMYENGKLVSEKKYDIVKEFGEALPEFVSEEIYVGCYPKQSHPGVLTDFQFFGRMLTHQELQRWTGCEERIEGDLVSWDTEDWIFDRAGNGSRIEYLEFEKDVCDLRNTSHHFFPAKFGFKKALGLCKKFQEN